MATSYCDYLYLYILPYLYYILQTLKEAYGNIIPTRKLHPDIDYLKSSWKEGKITWIPLKITTKVSKTSETLTCTYGCG
jgi:hypothetical protein